MVGPPERARSIQQKYEQKLNIDRPDHKPINRYRKSITPGDDNGP